MTRICIKERQYFLYRSRNSTQSAAVSFYSIAQTPVGWLDRDRGEIFSRIEVHKFSPRLSKIYSSHAGIQFFVSKQSSLFNLTPLFPFNLSSSLSPCKYEYTRSSLNVEQPTVFDKRQRFIIVPRNAFRSRNTHGTDLSHIRRGVSDWFKHGRF